MKTDMDIIAEQCAEIDRREKAVPSIVRNPCTRCGSTHGMFRSFYSYIDNSEMFYWMCECGRNHGNAPTEGGAVATWNEINTNPTGLRCAGLGAHKQDPVVGREIE